MMEAIAIETKSTVAFDKLIILQQFNSKTDTNGIAIDKIITMNKPKNKINPGYAKSIKKDSMM